MKKIYKIMAIMLVVILSLFVFSGCTETETRKDIQETLKVGDRLTKNQPTPQDIDYSLERYNLTRRAYWVNGQREKANTLPCSVQKPFGYIALFLENGSCAGKFVVDGKVSSLNSYLTPDSEKFEGGSYSVDWLPDIDGSYGENDKGIFFFTTDGKYVEWTGTYLYSDIPFEVQNPVVNYKEVK